MKMSDQTMAVGQTISITCQVSANPPPTHYEWTKVGDGTFNQTGPVLTIRNIQLHHAGTYRCTAVNTMTPTTGIQEQGIDTMNVTINVQKCKYYFHLKWISSCVYKVFSSILIFYTPVFRRDVLWYGDVRPSGSPSVRPSQFFALFSYMLWHIDLKFCVSLYFYARKIKFECYQFPSLFAGVMLLFDFKLLQICSFVHFSPTYFDILSSNFVYDFVLMYHNASFSVVILLQFLLELCLFVNLEYSKYTVFRTFLLHALTYWAESLHMTLFYCTTDQVPVLSIASIFVGVMPLLELRILEIHSFLHFSLTPFNILSWKFAYYFVFSVLQIKFECRQFASILELCLFSKLEYCKYSFLHFSLTRFDILSWNFAHDFVLLYYRSIFVGVMSLFGLRILEIHSFPHFSPAFFDILSWNFSYNFV